MWETVSIIIEWDTVEKVVPKDFCCESNIVNSYLLNVQVYDSQLTNNNNFQIARPELSGMMTLIMSALATQKLFSSFKYHQFVCCMRRFIYRYCVSALALTSTMSDVVFRKSSYIYNDIAENSFVYLFTHETRKLSNSFGNGQPRKRKKIETLGTNSFRGE